MVVTKMMKTRVATLVIMWVRVVTGVVTGTFVKMMVVMGSCLAPLRERLGRLGHGRGAQYSPCTLRVRKVPERQVPCF